MDAKAKLVADLRASEARLLNAVQELTPAQWNFREADGRWAIAEIVEHIAVFEGFLRGAVANALEQPPRDADTAGKEPLVLGLATSRHDKIPTREVNLPTGRFATGGAAVEAFRVARSKTIAFIEDASADFRRHTFAHVTFGDLDCGQWMTLLSTHLDRHLAQIAEIRAHQNFPEG